MITLRTLIWWLGAVFIGAGLGLFVADRGVLAAVALTIGVLVMAGQLTHQLLTNARQNNAHDEPSQIEHLDQDRRLEMIRGTSMHLRNMKYRYSVRYDRSNREPFTAQVNTVILGFVPVIILDNASDRQGHGYIAFPYDGNRWRGPGLPCAGDKDTVLKHAAKCVAPLDGQEHEEDDGV